MRKDVHLSAVKILHTGADGGHLYIRGRGEVPGEGETDIYAYFSSKEEERDFERQFTGQLVVVEARSLEFTRGQGGAVREIISWRFE
jgi:hypothetical protein